MNSPYRQRGTAAILFALMIPALFGIFVLGTDGSKALQEKARLLDATEAASLAVSARTVETNNEQDNEAAHKLVKDYLKHYFNEDFEVSKIEIIKKHCDEIPECVDSLDKGGSRYYQYHVFAQTAHHPWFQGDLVTMPETYQVQGQSVVNKYQNKAIDVALIADFSGSMQDGWDGGSQKKYRDLYDVVADVLTELKKYNELDTEDTNHVAFIPFNRYTSPVAEMQDYCTKYSDGKCTNTQKRRCYMSYVRPNGKSNISNNNAQLTVNNWSSSDYFYNKEKGKSDFVDINGGCRLNYENNKLLYNDAFFWDIDFTADFDSLETTMRSFDPWYGTASYQGLIRASRLFKNRIDGGNANERRLLIILSDGKDNYETTMTRLEAKGLCDDIREALSDKENDIYAKIALIGFDYKVYSTNPGLRSCVGDENVYKADNRDEILNAILELITEEIGRLTPDIAAK